MTSANAIVRRMNMVESIARFKKIRTVYGIAMDECGVHDLGNFFAMYGLKITMVPSVFVGFVQVSNKFMKIMRRY